MNPYNFSLLFFGFCTFFIALYIHLKRRDEIGYRYFVFCIFVTIWSLGTAITISENVRYDVALIMNRMANASAAFIAVTWFHFSLVYTHNTSFRKKFFSIICYCLAVLIAAISPTSFFISQMRSIGPFVYFPKADTPSFFF